MNIYAISLVTAEPAQLIFKKARLALIIDTSVEHAITEFCASEDLIHYGTKEDTFAALNTRDKTMQQYKIERICVVDKPTVIMI